MKKSIILVTYRSRETHLKCFLGYMKEYFNELPICVIEQSDINKWNKGLLFNIGYKFVAKNYDYIILHDVDFIPHILVDYSYSNVPTLLSTECSQFNYQHCYDKFFGGVIGMSREHYELINGFSNQFRGWGGEDDHLLQSFTEKGIKTEKRLGNRFENFVHPRLEVLGKDKNNPDYLHNLEILNRPRDFNEGLSTIEPLYNTSNIYYDNNYIHIKVKTHG